MIEAKQEMEEFTSEGAIIANMTGSDNFSLISQCEVRRYDQLGRWEDLNPPLDDVLRSLLIIYYSSYWMLIWNKPQSISGCVSA